MMESDSRRRFQPLGRLIFLLATIVFARGLVAATWFDELPASIRSTILWSASHETANLDEWTIPTFLYPGGGIFNTGGPEVFAQASATVAHSGKWSAETRITNALRSKNGPRAVRLMRWTDRAWDDQGQYFPTSAFYSTWLYLPHVYNPNKYPPWDPGDGGWWNIFQFKSPDQNDESQPLFTLNVRHDNQRKQMELYLYSKFNSPSSYLQTDFVALPANRWVHIEAYYVAATGPHGKIVVWQDGRPILRATGVITSLGGVDGTDTHAIWGIGNYTDHIVGDPAGDGSATIYFDDCAVSTQRLGQADVGIGHTKEGSP